MNVNDLQKYGYYGDEYFPDDVLEKIREEHTTDYYDDDNSYDVDI